jgi:hypothetical protein
LLKKNDRIEYDPIESDTLKIKVILYEGEERTPITIHASHNLSCRELNVRIEQEIGYTPHENFVLVHVGFHGDSVVEHYDRIYDMNFLNYLRVLREIFWIDDDFKLKLSLTYLGKIEFLLIDRNQFCGSQLFV